MEDRELLRDAVEHLHDARALLSRVQNRSLGVRYAAANVVKALAYLGVDTSNTYPPFLKSRVKEINEEMNPMAAYKGYCMKHRGEVQIKDPKVVTMKNGRKAVKGVCPKDGTKIFRFLPS